MVIRDGCSTATTYTAIPVIRPHRNVLMHSIRGKIFSGFMLKFAILNRFDIKGAVRTSDQKIGNLRRL